MILFVLALYVAQLGALAVLCWASTQASRPWRHREGGVDSILWARVSKGLAEVTPRSRHRDTRGEAGAGGTLDRRIEAERVGDSQGHQPSLRDREARRGWHRE